MQSPSGGGVPAASAAHVLFVERCGARHMPDVRAVFTALQQLGGRLSITGC
jgi:hypothetical protein